VQIKANERACTFPEKDLGLAKKTTEEIMTQ